MTFRRGVLLAVLALAIPALAAAQDFGVMESAETINRGNVKIGAYPMFILPDFGDNETGIGLTLGFGATDSLDIEGRAAFYDNMTFVGGDVEYWFMKNRPLDLSARGGLHFGFGDDGVGDIRGFDLSFIGSAPVTDRLELVGALDFAFNSFGDDFGFDDDYTTVHIVPGIEYAVSSDLDVVAEAGLGIGDDSSNYLAVGLSYYFR